MRICPIFFADYIAISDFQTGIVAPYLPAGARMHRVSNPIVLDDAGPKGAPAAGDVIFLGRLSPEKGPFLFAEAARKVGLVPTYVGDGPAAAELKARFPEARMLGWQQAEAARAALRGARALVFPSLWYEGQPLTVLEAKALGTPVIVSDACAGREEVEDGVTGLWFKGGDADDLARALLAIRDDTMVARMSSAAYAAFWADPPTLERHVARITAGLSGHVGAPATAGFRYVGGGPACRTGAITASGLGLGAKAPAAASWIENGHRVAGREDTSSLATAAGAPLGTRRSGLAWAGRPGIEGERIFSTQANLWPMALSPGGCRSPS